MNIRGGSIEANRFPGCFLAENALLKGRPYPSLPVRYSLIFTPCEHRQCRLSYILSLSLEWNTMKTSEESRTVPAKSTFPSFNCMTFGCNDKCCMYGVDVAIAERDALVADGLARADQFIGPILDEDGEPIFRTAIDEHGCVLLAEDRGCTLHGIGRKPGVCIVWPQDFGVAQKAFGEGYLPCFHAAMNSLAN
jgi:hypothetical protein